MIKQLNLLLFIFGTVTALFGYLLISPQAVEEPTTGFDSLSLRVCSAPHQIQELIIHGKTMEIGFSREPNSNEWKVNPDGSVGDERLIIPLINTICSLELGEQFDTEGRGLTTHKPTSRGVTKSAGETSVLGDEPSNLDIFGIINSGRHIEIITNESVKTTLKVGSKAPTTNQNYVMLNDEEYVRLADSRISTFFAITSDSLKLNTHEPELREHAAVMADTGQ